MSLSPMFTDHERRVIAADDRAVDRMFARRAVAWRVTRAPAVDKVCPHGVSVALYCRTCPVWGAR